LHSAVSDVLSSLDTTVEGLISDLLDVLNLGVLSDIGSLLSALGISTS
jgi:hypothetical protein